MVTQRDENGALARVLPIDRGMMPVADVTGRVRRIQEVMASLMKDGTHYGTIPGTPKPTLFQPGAELLCVTFRIAPTPRVEDLSTGDAVRYRVTMQAVSQASGELLGEGVGECSSDEMKYRWQRPVCDEEWNETSPELRREKWARGKNGNYKIKQIRTSPADIANTVLKMAYKRALISMTRTALACSDIFAQDLEDLPEEIRENVVEEHAPAKAPIAPPQRKAAAPAPAAVVDLHASREPGDEPEGLFPEDATAIEEVRVAKGTNAKTGHAWTAYFVKMRDGREAVTFSDTIGAKAQQAVGTDRLVRVTTEPSQKDPSKLTIVELAFVDGLAS
jgi:hypothetical protein